MTPQPRLSCHICFAVEIAAPVVSSFKLHLDMRQSATPQRRWEHDYWTRNTEQNTSNLWLISSVSACSLFMSCDPQAFNLWPGRPILTLRWLFQGSQLPLAWALRTFLSSVARNAWLSHSWPLYSGLPSIFYTHTHTHAKGLHCTKGLLEDCLWGLQLRPKGEGHLVKSHLLNNHTDNTVLDLEKYFFSWLLSRHAWWWHKAVNLLNNNQPLHC